MALFGQVFEFARAGRPLPGLGLGAAFQLHLAEQDIAELFRGTGIERLAGRCHFDLLLERALFLRELARQPRQHLAVDGNAAPLHVPRQNLQAIGAFQRLVDGGDALGGEPHLQRRPQP